METDGFPGAVNKLLVVANILNTFKITKLTVPELVQANTTATLDCEVHADDENFTLQWHLNGETVYEWTPYSEPRVLGVLEGRLDLGYRATRDPLQERRAMRIVEVTPELSGDYTCEVAGVPSRDSRHQAMLVYSPEEELSLSVQEEREHLRISCEARGVFPQPQLEIQSNQMSIGQQELRVWRDDGPYYSATCTARVDRATPRAARVACRLHVPLAGYSAIRELEYRGSDEACTSSAEKTISQAFSLTGPIISHLLITMCISKP